MDQILMVSARPLMSEVIEEGRRLIRALHEAQFERNGVLGLPERPGTMAAGDRFSTL